MTLEDFILAYDPSDCCACSRLGVDPWPLLRSSLLYQLREFIPQMREEDGAEYEPIASLDDLVQWAGTERELADCGTIWKQFQNHRMEVGK